MAEHLDVLVVGAGHHLQTECPRASNAGYVLRSQHLFPKQGSRFPWQVHQSYLRDYRALRLRGIDDEAMRFTNPAVDAPPPVAAGERQGVERSITSSTSP